MDKSKAIKLLKILNLTNIPLITVKENFDEIFNLFEKSTLFLSLNYLLLDDLLNFSQQIISIYLIYYEYKNIEIKLHPYYNLFLILYQNKKTLISPQLYEILTLILIENGFKNLDTLSVISILSTTNLLNEQNSLKDIDFEFNKRISHILISNNINDLKINNENDEIILIFLQSKWFFEEFKPNLLIPSPEISNLFEEEINPLLNFHQLDFIFDNNNSIGIKNSILLLLNRAPDSKLRPNELISVIKEIQRDPNIFDETKISQNKFNSLVENNPEIIKEIILLNGLKKPQLIKLLLSLDISVSSIDIIKHFIINISHSQDFLLNYIKNIIKILNNIKDLHIFTRKSRMFCKLLVFFIHSGIKFKFEIINEIKLFSQEQSLKNIKEIQELINLFK